jgi:hypothetical protein
MSLFSPIFQLEFHCQVPIEMDQQTDPMLFIAAPFWQFIIQYFAQSVGAAVVLLVETLWCKPEGHCFETL